MRVQRSWWRAAWVIYMSIVSAGVAYPETRVDEWQYERALDCAALAFVTTGAFDPESQEGISMTQRSGFFRSLYAAHLEVALERQVTNGEVTNATADRVNLLGALWVQSREEIILVNRLCWEWAAGIGQLISAGEDFNRSILVRPVAAVKIELDAEESAAADNIIKTAFELHFERGSITPRLPSQLFERAPYGR